MKVLNLLSHSLGTSFDYLLLELVEKDIEWNKFRSHANGLNNSVKLDKLNYEGFITNYFDSGSFYYKLSIKGWNHLKRDSLNYLDEVFALAARETGYIKSIKGVTKLEFERHCASMVSRGKAKTNCDLLTGNPESPTEKRTKMNDIYFN